MEKCPICDTNFDKKAWNQKYCSNKCKRSIKTNCKYCGKEVVRTKGKGRKYFCSRKCSELHAGRASERECLECNKKFAIKTSALSYGYGKYCSNECHNESMRTSRDKLACCEWCGDMYSILPGSKEKYCSKSCSNEGLRKWIDEDLLIKLYVEQELTSREVADVVGRDKKVVIDYLRYYGIKVRSDGFKNRERIVCNDGHEVRSYYERAFDNYLHKENIAHEYDARLPFNKRFMCDFKVGDIYIEIWGMVGWEPYDDRMSRKIKLYEENDCKLLQVFPEDFKDLGIKMNELKRLIK